MREEVGADAGVDAEHGGRTRVGLIPRSRRYRPSHPGRDHDAIRACPVALPHLPPHSCESLLPRCSQGSPAAHRLFHTALFPYLSQQLRSDELREAGEATRKAMLGELHGGGIVAARA